MDRSKASKDLDAWCEEERGRASSLARACEVTNTTVNHWRRGVILPGKGDRRDVIETHTGGAVKANEWDPSEAERALIAAAIREADAIEDLSPPAAVRGAA